jgi:hypothetical protein
MGQPVPKPCHQRRVGKPLSNDPRPEQSGSHAVACRERAGPCEIHSLRAASARSGRQQREQHEHDRRARQRADHDGDRERADERAAVTLDPQAPSPTVFSSGAVLARALAGCSHDQATAGETPA